MATLLHRSGSPSRVTIVGSTGPVQDLALLKILAIESLADKEGDTVFTFLASFPSRYVLPRINSPLCALASLVDTTSNLLLIDALKTIWG